MYNIKHNINAKKKNILTKIIFLIFFISFISFATIFSFLFLLSRQIISLPDGFLDYSKTLTKQNLSLQQIAKNVVPSVVGILSYSDADAKTLISEGSGVVLSKDGYIITNAHVSKGGNSFKVMLYDGKVYSASLIGSDTATDIALLKTDANNLAAANFTSAESASVGDIVLAIGNPGGIAFNSTTTMGIISATNRSIVTSEGYIVSCIQTDAAISPGNSGGALINTSGQVIGINSSKIVADGFEGLGFAITSDVALQIAYELKEYGHVKNRAALGVSYQFIDKQASQYYSIPKGIYIHDIINESAMIAGIKRGDIITAIEGNEIEDITDVTKILLQKKPGDKVDLKIYRSANGTIYTAQITLIETDKIK